MVISTVVGKAQISEKKRKTRMRKAQ